MINKYMIFEQQILNLPNLPRKPVKLTRLRQILHNLAKSALIWMVFTFLKMAADSGSNRPIKVINSPLFNLALQHNGSGLSIP